MSSAAAHRLRRSAPPGQLPLDAFLSPDMHPDPQIQSSQPGAEADDAAAPVVADEQSHLADVAARVEPRFRGSSDPWQDSPYRWLKNLPSVSRGRAATSLLATWLAESGVVLASDRRAGSRGLHLGAHPVVVKVSTEWSDGSLVFQGIRVGPHEIFALLGLHPRAAQLWLVPASAAFQHADPRGWLTVPAGPPPDWMDEHGGDPTRALHLARQLTQG